MKVGQHIVDEEYLEKLKSALSEFKVKYDKCSGRCSECQLGFDISEGKVTGELYLCDALDRAYRHFVS